MSNRLESSDPRRAPAPDAPHGSGDPSSTKAARSLIIGSTLAGLALYAATCAPGVLWQDSAMFQFRVWHFDLAGTEGLPLAHPLYILLARLLACLPLGEFAYRVNLFSALCGAASLGLAADFLLCMTRSRRAALAGVIVLGVSHTFWTHAVIAEVYDLYAVGLLAELCLLERFFRCRRARWLVFAAIANGLNQSNHLMAILHWPAYAGVLFWGLRGRTLNLRGIVAVFAGLAAGSSPYLYLMGRELVAGRPAGVVVWEALVGPPNRATFVLTYAFPFARQVKNAILYFVMNFPTPLLLLAPLGLMGAWRDRAMTWFALFGGAIFAVGFVFAFRYVVPDQFVFYTPCYVLMALFIGIGIAHWQSGRTRRSWLVFVLAVLPAAVYEVAPTVLRRAQMTLGTRDLPYRDSYTYFIRPRKNGDTGAERYAREALALVAPGGALFGDVTVKNPVTYVRDVLGAGRDVVIGVPGDITPAEPTVEMSPEGIAPYVERGLAYSCSAGVYLPKWLRDSHDVTPHGIIYRLTRKAQSEPPTRPGGTLP
ncbi:MAG: hypothetical protein DCC65_02195 [Planctomycetota bacterium]|nr:MAG: hypothetical protein DCC65_02195 [Planctomycetota bacterium]